MIFSFKANLNIIQWLISVVIVQYIYQFRLLCIENIITSNYKCLLKDQPRAKEKNVKRDDIEVCAKEKNLTK